MNIQEAVSTGKLIKRKSWQKGDCIKVKGCYAYWIDKKGNIKRFQLMIDDIKANDWEVC